jgi:hypothetical protein
MVLFWPTGNRKCIRHMFIIMYSSALHFHLNNSLRFMMPSQPRLFSIQWQLTGESRIGKDGSGHSLTMVLLPGWTEENHEKTESGYVVSGRDSYQAPPEYKCLKIRCLEKYTWA